ncbi:MAG TPA: FGGY family carbohydrate kinase [Candidatus Brocadiia bacterium]|nr:FGGY family carbohydrate kinase [Candidatus Brocadiia bacterium]
MTTSDWILAIDLGTTTIKAAAFSPDGKMPAVERREYDFESPHPSWAQIPPERVLDAVYECVRRIVSRMAGSAPLAIGFSSQGHTFICRDRDGRAVHPYITWLDGRAASQAERILEKFGRREIFERAGYAAFGGYVPAAKLVWLREREPELFSRIASFALIEDDIIQRLTGCAATDYALAGTTGMFDLRRKRWWPEMLEEIGISESALPGPRQAGAIAGTLLPDIAGQLNLPPGIPVTVGTNDQIAGAIGAGNVQPGIVTETTGTAMAAVTTISEPPVSAAAGIPWWGHAVPDCYSALAFCSTAGVVLKWFRDAVWPDASYEEIIRAASTVTAGCEGLVLLPHFSGTGCPDFLETARGCFCGLELRHGRAHLARAIIEGVSFALKDLVELLSNNCGAIGSVRSLGGAAQSDIWLQMKADILSIPVERPVNPEAALAGGMILAATAIGIYPDVRTAALKIYHPERIFAPSPINSEAYHRAYMRYRKAYEQNYGR